MLCQFLDDSDCEVWWVGDREHARVGESLVPDTNTLPTSSTQLLRSDVATATSLGGHRKEMGSSLSIGEKC